MDPIARAKRPHLPFVPTDEQRGFVRIMAATQIPVDTIAKLVINPQTKKGISTTTLQKKFRHDLDNGHTMVKAFVVNKLFQQIQNNNIAAIIFFLKTQCGWHPASRPGIEGELLGAGVDGARDITPDQIPSDPVLAARMYQQLVQAS